MKYLLIFIFLTLISALGVYLDILILALVFGFLALLYLAEVILRFKGYSLQDIFQPLPMYCPSCNNRLNLEERNIYVLYNSQIVAPSVNLWFTKCPKCGFNLYSRKGKKV